MSEKERPKLDAAKQPIETEEIRTDINCHNCSKNFIALLDYRIDGNHVIECPHCGHKHYRAIKAGQITEDRWSSDHGGSPDIKCRRVWKHDVLVAQTSSASHFLRERWLNRSE